ncbi:MAG: ASKHA domain-containing protein [Nitrospirae bacterium]|nr:ASKHA domain-containing protein [Nitrospirota bacterium]MCL5423325.1 ASKHA domain-containing protein [Nitrospirota bacterium]
MEVRLTTGKTVSVSEGDDLYHALKGQGVYLVASCGGKGACGKCKVRIVEGRSESVSHGKLGPKEREEGFVLACQTYPKGDILIEIPKESMLAVGDKIAISKSRDLFELFESFNVAVSPVVKHLCLDVPPPTIHDNISDIERLKRALEERGIKGMRFSHGFVSSMAKALREAEWKIILGYTEDSGAVFISNGNNYKDKYGLAVDIGTTTVVVYLVDLADGRLIDVGSTYNSQIRYGDDVITRIIHATEGGGLSELRDAVIGDINDILTPLVERHSIEREDIASVVVAGNTTMSQLFWGLDPAPIREEPYIPTVNFFPKWRAGTAKIAVNSQAPVYTVPCIASYVGGDIVAGVLASKMHRNPEVALFMDIGTNGEIAVGNNEWLMTAACSAGPCFEGSGIRHGMRATEGAIEKVRIDPKTYEPELGVIGDAKPVGICGSGMIDAISEMFLTGVIDQKGKLVRHRKTDRIRGGEDGFEFVFSREGRDVALTEADIENIIRAKAAIYAGVSLLLKEVGFGLDAVERVYIAGGFGNYLDIERAIILGMLPDLPRDKFTFLGNTSITGAYLCLLSESLRREAEEIASKMTYMELSVSRGFMDEYLSALFLPHTDIGLFPTVAGLMAK